MSNSATNRTVLRSSVTAVAIGFGLSLASSAHAADATGPGADAVRAKAAEIGGLEPITPNPQWTPDGGVFQFYNDNDAAIYWSANTGAHLVHGDILSKWRELGFEAATGYPTEDEGEPAEPCGNAERSQAFGGGGHFLCWRPDVFTPDGLLTEAEVWEAWQVI
jgi:uncharacterized protein with LGFP repeats